MEEIKKKYSLSDNILCQMMEGLPKLETFRAQRAKGGISGNMLRLPKSQTASTSAENVPQLEIGRPSQVLVTPSGPIPMEEP